MGTASKRKGKLNTAKQRLHREDERERLQNGSGSGGSGNDTLATEDILKLRRECLGLNLSLHYDNPLQIVRGQGCHLYDSSGVEYLDAVNNVPCVGHSNPVVAEAVSRAMSTVNTNTRYVRQDIVEYSKDLLSHFPDTLEVVYFCNSGSEANDLAIRMAREVCPEDCTDVVVMAGAYHGNTRQCMEISPYKFNSQRGKGKEESTHVMPFPDAYRNVNMDGKEESEHVLREMELSNRKACAFICESILGCAGQIVLPEGYLSDVYSAMRSRGVLCIADEVQCGFGRVGTHFWGFQTQNVVPDIVVLGKPIGNGFPLAAVVTTRRVADRFSDGVEYFNTFGGCNAACAAGASVLKEIREKKLQENAETVGNYLLRLLEQFKITCPYVGDVRGKGLFIGVEFVTSKSTMYPAPSIAKFVCNTMKKRKVLVSADGVHNNVIKIKPPLVFSKENADKLVSELIYTFSNDNMTPEALWTMLDSSMRYVTKTKLQRGYPRGAESPAGQTFHVSMQNERLQTEESGTLKYPSGTILALISSSFVSFALGSLVTIKVLHGLKN
mmetsp:Transcript_5644/g.14572  ORF Transcript_5644/g.14572 Transcript_5644/m.14572 type:complete len:554 (-) Transcript_5644:31-1692(-)